MATTAASGAPAAATANKAELLAIADAVAREKLIDKAIVIEAMEDAIRARPPATAPRTTSAPSSTRKPATSACGACSKWSKSPRIISSRSI